MVVQMTRANTSAISMTRAPILTACAILDLRVHLSPDRRAHRLLLQSRWSRRLPATTFHARLVSPAFRRRRDLGRRAQQCHRRRRQRCARIDARSCSPRSRSIAPISPAKHSSAASCLLPLILPGIITGLSLLMFAVFVHLPLSLLTVFLGHGTALISVATTELFAGLQKIDRAQEEASLDLGATPWQTFWRVTLPNLKLSLIAAGLLIFTLSMDEIAVTFFLIGRDNTLAARNLGPPAPRHHAGNQRHLDAHLRRVRRAHRRSGIAFARAASAPKPQESSRATTQHRSKPHDTESTIRAAISSNLSSQAPLPPVVRSTTRSSRSHPPLTDLPPSAAPQVDGEHFEICHEVRDGHAFDLPAPSRKVEVVIVGAGSAGLSAAYFLRGKDFLLLEKEDHFGGNAYQEEFDGQPFATGSAYAFRDDEGDQLATRNRPQAAACRQSRSHHHQQNVCRRHVDQRHRRIALSQSMSAPAFANFATTCARSMRSKRMKELDAQPFTKFTAGYAQEVQQWWDGYGPSNWGATCQDTSAYVGIEAARGLAAGEDSKRVILPGGLGCITHKLVEVLQPKYGERMLGNATVVAVVSEKDEVKITYIREWQHQSPSAPKPCSCARRSTSPRASCAAFPTHKKPRCSARASRPIPSSTSSSTSPSTIAATTTGAPATPSPISSSPTGPFAISPATNRKTTSSRSTRRSAKRSAPRCSTKTQCKILAARVLADFQKLMPEFNVDPIEVRIYRRGHPMFMAVPGQYTVNRIAAAQPMDRVYFGNADSGGPESLTSEAIRLSKVGAEWLDLVLAGKPGAKALVQKALAPTRRSVK